MSICSLDQHCLKQQMVRSLTTRPSSARRRATNNEDHGSTGKCLFQCAPLSVDRVLAPRRFKVVQRVKD